jgi:hypothetical protein
MKLTASICTLVLTLLSSVGCGDDSPTSPTTTDTTTTAAAAPTFTEEFSAVVPVTGSVFYSFTVTTYGTVNVSLTSVSGQYVPSTVTIGLGLGKPEAETCNTTTSVSTPAGAGPQLSAVYDPGTYCVKVSDVGNLFSAANFAVTIAYP